MYFYHVTDKKNVDSILKNGITPQIGENSKICEESTQAIYLCKRKDVPYWKTILGKSAVIQVSSLNEDDVEKYEYSCYNEYVYEKQIFPEQCKQIYVPNKESAMHDLCISYLYSISGITVTLARHYSGADYDMDSLYVMLNSLVRTLNRLDYSCVEKKEIRHELKAAGENGHCTFVDHYLDTPFRLYQQLLNYPKDDLTELRETLYAFIKQNFKGCLRVETGAWTA